MTLFQSMHSDQAKDSAIGADPSTNGWTWTGHSVGHLSMGVQSMIILKLLQYDGTVSAQHMGMPWAVRRFSCLSLVVGCKSVIT